MQFYDTHLNEMHRIAYEYMNEDEDDRPLLIYSRLHFYERILFYQDMDGLDMNNSCLSRFRTLGRYK